MGGDLRLGIFDQNGDGEVVGGMVVMRYGENADKVIKAVKEKMKEVEKGLPEGVSFKTSYDRSELIEKAIESVKGTLLEEMIAVSIVIPALPVSLEKCPDYSDSIADIGSRRLHPLGDFWHFFQYHVTYGYCTRNWCGRGRWHCNGGKCLSNISERRQEFDNNKTESE